MTAQIETFGGELRKLRRQDPRDLSLVETAAAAGTTVSAMSDIERNVMLLATPAIKKLLQFLDKPGEFNLLMSLVDEAAGIRKGIMDDELPDYEVITGWLQRAPMTWLPGIFHQVVMSSLEKAVFKPGGMESRIKYCEKIFAEGPNRVLREPERPHAYDDGSVGV